MTRVGSTGMSLEGALIVGVLGGRVSLQKSLGLPFERDVIGAMGQLDIASESTAAVERAYPRLPPFPRDQRPTNLLGFDDLIVGFGLYLVVKLTDAVIADVATQVYQERVQPAVEKLWASMRRRGQDPRQGCTAVFDHWFDGSQVLVRVVVHFKATDKLMDTQVVEKALRHAALWIQQHPVTHRVLTFEVRNGDLIPEPELSEPV